MAKNDRTESKGPPRARRRRRPPVLELKASEIGAAEPEREAVKPESEAEKQIPADKPWDRWRAEAAAVDWRGLASAPIVTGLAGAAIGALLLFMLLPRAEGSDPRVSELSGEVAKLSARIESLAARPLPSPAPDQSGLGARIDKLTAAIGEAEQRLAAVEKRPEPKAPDLSSVNQRTAAMEGTLGALRGDLAELKRIAEQAPAAATPQAIEGIAGRIGGLEERIAALAATRAALPAVTATAAEFIALNALTGAVRSGRPFVRELDTARAMLGERAAPLAALDPVAAKGLPDIAALEQRFSQLVPEILRGPEAGGNFFQRLVNNASRLVEVRPVGEPEGNSVGAIVARAETKLGRGDLNGAILEIESLPEAQKSRAANWLAAAKQRRDAEATVAKLIEASLSGTRERDKP